MKTFPNGKPALTGEGIEAARRHITKAFEDVHTRLVSEMPVATAATCPRVRLARLAAPIIQEAEKQFRLAQLHRRNESILVIRDVTETPEELFAQALASLNTLPGRR